MVKVEDKNLRNLFAQTPEILHSEGKIVVHNYGNPISEEDQRKLFDPYERTVKVAQGTVTGWGLGLTLVRGVAEAHKGKVEVRSLLEHGTTFTVELPKDSR